MIRPGLCSVTFRELDPAAVVDAAANAGLACIEWAGDVHVPAGDVDAARRARHLTEKAGLAVASYGSYLRFDGSDPAGSDQAVLDSASALGAPRIRVWAGSEGSANVGPTERAGIVGRLQDFTDAAASAGIEVGLEFHGRTLTDEVASTERLLADVGREGLRTYWQPHQGMPTGQAVDTLRRVLDQVSTIHVFSWWPLAERLPLRDRADLWREVFAVLAAHGGHRDALLEFVPGDDPGILAREAATLRELIAAGALAGGEAGGCGTPSADGETR